MCFGAVQCHLWWAGWQWVIASEQLGQRKEVFVRAQMMMANKGFRVQVDRVTSGGAGILDGEDDHNGVDVDMLYQVFAGLERNGIIFFGRDRVKRKGHRFNGKGRGGLCDGSLRNDVGVQIQELADVNYEEANRGDCSVSNGEDHGLVKFNCTASNCRSVIKETFLNHELSANNLEFGDALAHDSGTMSKNNSILNEAKSVVQDCYHLGLSFK